MPRVTKKYGDEYLVPVLWIRGKYPRISIPLEVAEKVGLGPDVNFVALKVEGGNIIIRKARVVVE